MRPKFMTPSFLSAPKAQAEKDRPVLITEGAAWELGRQLSRL